jgi:hypothetical protein
MRRTAPPYLRAWYADQDKRQQFRREMSAITLLIWGAVVLILIALAVWLRHDNRDDISLTDGVDRAEIVNRWRQ